jgi:hypothetical protein
LEYQQKSSEEVLQKASRLEEVGYREYLNSTTTREVK